MGIQKMNRERLDYWVERRIKEANLRDMIKNLGMRIENKQRSSVHASFWTVFKSGTRTI